MNLWPLAIALLSLVATGRALVIGSASVGGEGFRRDEEPALYWGIVVALALMTCFLLYRAFLG